MDIDLPPDPSPINSRVVKRLHDYGVPMECLGRLGEGLVAFVADRHPDLPKLVSAILPIDEEVAEMFQSSNVEFKTTLRNRLKECKPWLLWLMFSGDPAASLDNLSRLTAGRGVCGAVWGTNDIAYRCRTCEHDPTCAICVPCFQNGNHKEHDYSIIYTGGGCCDCGDATAWKREGFCSKHKGAEQIQSLPQEYAISVGPVLDVLLQFWKYNLTTVQSSSQVNARVKEYATELTIWVVEMLLEFCKYSESLLSFVSKRLTALDGLLEVLVRSESSLGQKVARKLHELLLKLLGEPTFKYAFAKVFLGYYPFVVNEVIKEGTDAALKKYPLLLKFSVQIFTVPTLTPRLVEEMDLLAILLQCLGDIFSHCAGKDGSLQGSKLGNLYEIAARVVDDIRFVMSHSVVPKYITCERRDILRTWMKLLSFLQGMSSMKRETGLHVEEDNDNASIPFFLGHPVAEIHSLLVDGAFACNDEGVEDFFLKMDTDVVDEGEGPRHAKVGRLSQESSVSSAAVRNSAIGSDTMLGDAKSDSGCHSSIPSAVIWLAHECLRAIENWLEADNTSGIRTSQNTSNTADSKFGGALKRTIYKFKRGNYIFGHISSEGIIRHGAPPTDSLMTTSLEDAKDTALNSMEYPDSAGPDDSPVEGNCSTEFDALCNDCPIEGNGSTEFDTLRILSLSEWPNIVFNVSSQHVSVHIYLHRLLALLLKRSLRRSFGESDVGDLMASAVHKDFFGRVLLGYHPVGFSAFVMEHPLRNRVFCAQVQAGMWRKNGDAAILSCEWYRSVRWSEQGLELDLFLLQCCAALAPADSYVARIIDRFGLSEYFSLNPEKYCEYDPVLVQAMLTLIVQIVQERHFSGLTTADNLKRELVRRLAIGDATHSQLVKSLPLDLSKSDQLQENIEAVAVYSNPSGFNQGTYSLRSAFWKELDLYHPRWSSRELQVAEERYMRFCNVSALTTQLPRWKKIYLPLQGVARVATCTAVLQVIRAVLFYAVFSDQIKDKRAPDGALLAALHLLSLSLDAFSQQTQTKDASFHSGDSAPVVELSVEVISAPLHYDAGEQSLISLLVSLMRMHKRENLNNFLEAGSCNISTLIENILKRFAEIDSGCMALLQQLAPEMVVQLSESTPLNDTSMTTFESDSEKRKIIARQRQAAVMAKMKAEQSKFLAIIKSEPEESSSEDEPDFKELAQDVCSLCHDPESKDPLSFLVLLQKSRLLSIIDRGPPSWDRGWQADKENLTETNTVTGQSGVITSRSPPLQNAEVPYTFKNGNDQNIYTLEMLEDDMYLSIRNEMHGIVVQSESGMGDDHFQEDGSHLNDYMITDSVFLGKYGAALSAEMFEQPSASARAPHSEMKVDSASEPSSYDGFGPEGCDGIHLSSCGHAVHQACLDRYLTSLRERYTRRNVVEGAHIVNPEQGEFLCPVCRRLANSVLSSFPGNFLKDKPDISTVSTSESSSPFILSNEKTEGFLLYKGFSLMQSAAKMVRNGNVLRTIPVQKGKRLGPNLDSLSKMLSKLYFAKRREKFFESSAINEFMIMWDTLKYSLVSMEISARAGNLSMTPTYSLDSLYKELESSSGFVLSKLLKIVQFMRTSNTFHVLQRYRGIQLFGDSLCLAASRECRHKSAHEGEAWEELDKEVLFPDVRFWNRAADPVIAHDAFSSFMWAIFCLPQPFLSCEDSILSLVHVFYSVTVLQAIITCCGSKELKNDDFLFSDSLIMDIINVGRGSGSGSARCQFVSRYMNPSSDNIMVAIRRLSFPFLRRCALLSKLLRTSVSAPFCSRNETSSSHTLDNVDMEIDLVELNEVEKLENMFKIPPLNVILKDRVLREIAMKWYHHFCEVSGTQSFHGTLYLTPVVPFKLMQLPHVYQDLPQRYIKQSCAECKNVIDEPALCLLCGRLCSPNWKPCCSKSGCQPHAKICGAGTGVFLLVKKTTILLQRCARQAPWPSPYLDAFGEEDIDMHRGKPLYLNEERYAALCHMVASHGLDRSSRVLGHTTIGNFFLV